MSSIYFSHSAQPESLGSNKYRKKITYKFNGKAVASKHKGKNICINYIPGLTNTKAPTDIYKAFIYVVNGEHHPTSPTLILKTPKGKNSYNSASTAAGISEQG